MSTTIDDVCRSAWGATQSDSAIAYDSLDDDYRAKLIERAQAVLGGEYPDGAWKSFETEVLKLADGRGEMQIGKKPAKKPAAPVPVAVPVAKKTTVIKKKP